MEVRGRVAWVLGEVLLAFVLQRLEGLGMDCSCFCIVGLEGVGVGVGVGEHTSPEVVWCVKVYHHSES